MPFDCASSGCSLGVYYGDQYTINQPITFMLKLHRFIIAQEQKQKKQKME